MTTVSEEEMKRGIRNSLEHIDTVVFAYLFGSRAAGRTRPSSDIDVAVFLKDGVDLIEEKLSIIGCLTQHLKTDAIDVVVLNTAPISLIGRILSNREVVIDREPYRRHSFESLALREYMDFSVKETTILDSRFKLGR